MAITKIKAATLTEVIVAMALLGIITGVSMMIFSNVIQGGVSTKQVQIEHQLNGIISQIFADEIIKNSELDYDKFAVNVEFTEHLEKPNLQVVFISATKNDEDQIFLEKKILKRKIEY